MNEDRQLTPALRAALKLLALDGSAEVDDAVEVLAPCENLTVRLTRLAAESLRFGGGRIPELRQAIRLLGLPLVERLAIFYAFRPLLKNPKQLPLDEQLHWRHAAVASAVANRLSEHLAPELELLARRAGYLCEIGQLVLADSRPETYADIRAQAAESGRPLHEVEQEELGVAHPEFGAEVLRAFGLPSEICEAVAAHHDPGRILEGGGGERTLAALLHVSTTCAEIATVGCPTAAECLPGLLSAYFGFNPSEVQHLSAQIERTVPGSTKVRTNTSTREVSPLFEEGPSTISALLRAVGQEIVS